MTLGQCERHFFCHLEFLPNKIYDLNADFVDRFGRVTQSRRHLVLPSPFCSIKTTVGSTVASFGLK